LSNSQVRHQVSPRVLTLVVHPPTYTSEFFPPLFRPLSSLATVTIAILRDKVITMRPEPDADWGLQRTTCQQSTLNQAVVGTNAESFTRAYYSKRQSTQRRLIYECDHSNELLMECMVVGPMCAPPCAIKRQLGLSLCRSPLFFHKMRKKPGTPESPHMPPAGERKSI
jgi:hypothetical protein